MTDKEELTATSLPEFSKTDLDAAAKIMENCLPELKKYFDITLEVWTEQGKTVRELLDKLYTK